LDAGLDTGWTGWTIGLKSTVEVGQQHCKKEKVPNLGTKTRKHIHFLGYLGIDW